VKLDVGLEIQVSLSHSVFPFLVEMRQDDVFAFACDYSSEAVQVVKSNPAYDEKRIKALVYDITSLDIPTDIEPESLDICICIFVLSAIHPRDWEQAASNIYKMLKPGGLLLFRDYGRHDLAQLRFKQGRMLDDHFYCRGDGTRVYFFTNEQVGTMFSRFEVIQNVMDRRLLVNRSKKLKMFRCWIQGKFRKPLE
jgi:tRNAThr (cytosine32-N3)-methyltransferase